MEMKNIIMLLAALSLPSTVKAQPAIDVGAALASLDGRWEGTLEYLDYGANRWFGIPVVTTIEDQGDGATIIRKSDFDDGPKVGNVRITSVELFDATKGTVSVGTFRKGQEAGIYTYSIRLEGQAADPTHWTIVEESKGQDDNRPALLRITTVRNGDQIESLKEVDFQDDDKSEWLSRNRTKLVLKR
jgi:hypothetical protein